MKSVVFVDCFNTIIGRRVIPEDVIIAWGKKMHDSHKEISFVDFFRMFKNCWKRLNHVAMFEVEKSDFITTTDEIFALMAKDIKKYNLIQNFDEEAFVKEAQEKYIDSEHELHYLKKKTIKLLEKKKKMGCKIYIVSDFYCGADTIKLWLTKLGLDVDNLIDKIFVSCDYSASKTNGTLYKKVLDELNLDPKDVLMIGDNPTADKRGAKKQGIKSKLIAPHIALPSKDFYKTLQKINIPNEYQEIFDEDLENGSYSNYAFPLYLVIKRLADSCIRKGTKNLFFLARDGFFLQKLFDEYCKYHDLDINTHYFAVSRKSALNACILPYETAFMGLSNRPFVSVRNFLKTLSFTKEDIEKIGREEKINVNYFYPKLSNTKAYKKVLQNATFKNFYDEYRQKQHKAFIEYVNSFCVDIKKEGFNYVDSGWLGNMGRHIKRALQENENDDVKLQGYFIGCMSETCVQENMTGLLFSYHSQKTWEGKILTYRKLNYEALLRTDQNSCHSYDEKSFAPILASGNEEEKTYNKYVKPMQDRIFDKFKKVMQADEKVYAPLESVVTKIVYNIFKKSNKKDRIFFDGTQNTYCDNFAYIGFTYALFKSWMRRSLFRARDAFFLISNSGRIKRKRIALN